MKRATVGPSAGSVTTRAMTTSGPANATVSGSPVFTAEAVPATWMLKLETACARAGGAAKTRPPNRRGRAIFMAVAPCRSEGGGKDVIGGNERATLGSGDRRRKPVHERRPAVVDLPAHQHRVVLVHGVVAVLHEHPLEVAELHGDGDGSARPEAVDILAALLPWPHLV